MALDPEQLAEKSIPYTAGVGAFAGLIYGLQIGGIGGIIVGVPIGGAIGAITPFFVVQVLLLGLAAAFWIGVPALVLYAIISLWGVGK